MPLDLSLISFHYQAPNFAFTNRTALKVFLIKEARKRKRSLDHISYIFCSDEYLLDLNRQHLYHDTLTDIITFELSPVGEPILSDVYISIDRVRENALIHKETFSREIHRVIFHGFLHLMGLKDKSAKEASAMRRAEEELLNKYFVPRGTTQH